jgi:hypothetical protein
MEWSSDGTVGLFQQEDSLYLVNGKSGELTEIAKDNIMPWPDISDDGKLIAYCERVECSDVLKGLEMLPKHQADKIKFHTKWLAKEILNKGTLDGIFPQLPETRIKGSFFGINKPKRTSEYTEEYCDWVIRYLHETADDKLSKALANETALKSKDKTLTYYRLLKIPVGKLNEKTIITTSVSPLFKTVFSPTSSYIAYLMQNPEGQKEAGLLVNMNYQLYVVAAKENTTAVLIDNDVAFGHDWRQDEQAIAYMKGTFEDDISFGELKEVQVIDGNGKLLTGELGTSIGAFASHRCTGLTSSRIGIQFYPWAKVEYGPGGRIFFVCMSLTIPSTQQDDPELQLFCYDTITKTLNSVLPSHLSEYMDSAMPAYQFSLSPDGKKVLLPIDGHQFMIYELGATSSETPINENEGFGDQGELELAPAWKGNDRISCLVSEESRFLKNQKPLSKEMVILGTDGEFIQNISKNWPVSLKN